MIEPLVKTIEVPCDQAEAFEVFVDQMGTWWPLARFSASVKFGMSPQGLRVQPRVGGTIVETSTDGTEHLWGTILEYDPHDYVRMDLHIGLPPQTASRVEVRFVALEAERTRVVLTQSEWERFGRFAEMMLQGYPRGWVVIFEQAYRMACGGRAPEDRAGEG
ncbi:MAG: SRPBCC domain-containing protein [Myxococcota bacterium]